MCAAHRSILFTAIQACQAFRSFVDVVPLPQLSKLTVSDLAPNHALSLITIADVPISRVVSGYDGAPGIRFLPPVMKPHVGRGYANDGSQQNTAYEIAISFLQEIRITRRD